MKFSILKWFAWAPFFLTVSCSSAEEQEQREPLLHRSTAVACGSDRPAVNDSCSPGALADPNYAEFCACGSDSDCVDGLNGRCQSGQEGTYCSYDDCLADSDCGGGGCFCEAKFEWYSSAPRNRCVSGDCTLDSDCESGYCSPSYDECGRPEFRCHTPNDECIDDTDCPASGSDGNPRCAFLKEIQRWACTTQSQCGDG